MENETLKQKIMNGKWKNKTKENQTGKSKKKYINNK